MLSRRLIGAWIFDGSLLMTRVATYRASSSYANRISSWSVGVAPSTGSFCTKSRSGGMLAHAASVSLPSTSMLPVATFTAVALFWGRSIFGLAADWADETVRGDAKARTTNNLAMLADMFAGVPHYHMYDPRTDRFVERVAIPGACAKRIA